MEEPLQQKWEKWEEDYIEYISKETKDVLEEAYNKDRWF